MADENTDGLVLPVGLTEKQFLQQIARMETRLAKFESGTVTRFKKNNAEIAGSFTGMSRQTTASLQNVSYQLQDVFVQIQGGQGAVRALSQQMPQLLSGFGAFGAVAGLAVAALAPLVGSLFSTSEAAAEAAAALERVTAAQEALAKATYNAQVEIDKLRFGVDEGYQVELLREQVRLRDEIARKYAEAQTYLSTTTDSLDRQKITVDEMNAEIGALVSKYEANAKSLGDQQTRAAQLSVMEGVRAQRAGEVAARQREAAEAMARAASFYGTAADLAGKLSISTADAAAAASLISGVSFGNIAAAAGWAANLAANLRAAAAVNTNMMSQGQTTGSTTWYYGQTADSLLPPTAGLAPMKAVGGGGGGGGGGSNGKLDALIEDLKTEREILEEWYAESLALLNSASEAELEALGGKHEAIERLEQEHQDRMAEIKEEANRFSLEMALGAGADVLGAMGAFNRKALKVSQAFAAAEALVSTYKGAAKALEKGALGFPEAAAVIAKGLAFVGAIKGINEGGGGAARGGGATAAAAPVLPVQRIDISASGSPDFMAGMQSLIDTLSAAAGRGLRVDPRLVAA